MTKIHRLKDYGISSESIYHNKKQLSQILDGNWTKLVDTKNGGIYKKIINDICYLKGSITQGEISNGVYAPLGFNLPYQYVQIIPGGGNAYTKMYINANSNWLGFASGTGDNDEINYSVCGNFSIK